MCICMGVLQREHVCALVRARVFTFARVCLCLRMCMSNCMYA